MNKNSHIRSVNKNVFQAKVTNNCEDKKRSLFVTEDGKEFTSSMCSRYAKNAWGKAGHAKSSYTATKGRKATVSTVSIASLIFLVY